MEQKDDTKHNKQNEFDLDISDNMHSAVLIHNSTVRYMYSQRPNHMLKWVSVWWNAPFIAYMYV